MFEDKIDQTRHFEGNTKLPYQIIFVLTKEKEYKVDFFNCFSELFFVICFSFGGSMNSTSTFVSILFSTNPLSTNPILEKELSQPNLTSTGNPVPSSHNLSDFIVLQNERKVVCLSIYTSYYVHLI